MIYCKGLFFLYDLCTPWGLLLKMCGLGATAFYSYLRKHNRFIL